MGLAGVNGPERRLETYVRETLRLAAAGAHRPAAALGSAQLPKECLTRLGDLHREQAAPFLAALEELEVPNQQLTARLLAGVIDAARGALDAGVALDLVTERTLALGRFAALPQP